MPPSDEQLLAQKVDQNREALSDIRASVRVLEAGQVQQEKTLGQIQTTTSALGDAFRGELREMREAQAAEREAERASLAKDREADRKAASEWWANAWKLAAAVVTTVSLLAGGTYVGVVQAGATPSHEAP